MRSLALGGEGGRGGGFGDLICHVDVVDVGGGGGGGGFGDPICHVDVVVVVVGGGG